MKSKPVQIRGAHHCIGTSRVTADAIFGIIHSRAVANGGMISGDAINDAKAQFFENLPSAFDVFSTINRECMEASKGSAPDPLSQDMLLSSLLADCGEGSAEHAFKLQIEQCGEKWLNYFFQGFAQYCRQDIDPKAWERLMAAYVHAAEKCKANLLISDLIKRNDVKEILLECISPFSDPHKFEEAINSISAAINQYVANRYNIAGPYIAKITDDQMKRFLTMLLNELPLKLTGKSKAEMAF